MRSCPGYLCLLVGFLAGCDNPHPSITGVTPQQAYAGDDVTLTILGDNFVPATILDPDQGRRIATSDGFRIRVGDGTSWADLADIAWLSPGEITGWLSAGPASAFVPGPLDVELRDPRGQSATLPGGFVELGPDLTPPIVTFTSPDPAAAFTPGMLLRGSFHAADAAPGKLTGLRWAYFEGNDVDHSVADGSCWVAPQAAEGDCSFQVQINPQLRGGDVVRIRAYAEDNAASPNTGQSEMAISLLAAPEVVSVTPSDGGTLGGTDVVIRAVGLLPGSTASVDGVLLFPNGGLVVDANTLSGHVPPHAPGAASLLVHTPVGDARGVLTFAYLPPPQIDAISPDVGSAAGGTAVTITGSNFSQDTQIYFGTTLTGAAPLASPFLASPTTIVGTAPAGSGRGTVWAFDANLGYSKLDGGFSWRAP